MKIYKWIDKYNYKNSLKIISKYSEGLSRGESSFYSINTKFWAKYLLRLVLVLCSTITFQKKAYHSFFKILSTRYSPFYPADTNSVYYIKLRDLIATLFGFRYFVDDEISPLYSNNKVLKSKLTFEISKTPLVSIIIPIHNHLDYTYNCLQSLLQNIDQSVEYEVIIVDDCSTDQSNIFFEKCVEGVRYYKNDVNLGFINSCNKGAVHARGKLICFLNNDVQICKNWLESLIKTLENNEFGCVGSKLVYANGLLQEAGGIVYNDANAANYGKYRDAEDPEYNYQRAVDYCSGASLIFRKNEFEQLGCFNTDLAPAYYEDTDICFRIRHILGKKVIYQPLSQLIHFEGISSGTNVEDNSIKRFQKINNQKFLEIWREELKKYADLGNAQESIKKNKSAKTILFIDDTVPTPNKDSGSVRLFEILKMVSALDYHIIFIPNDGEKKGLYFNDLVHVGVEVLYRFPNRRFIMKRISEKVSEIDFVWICKPHNNIPFEFLFRLKPTLKRIYDTIDLHYIRMKREADLTNNVALAQESEGIKRNELEFARKADFTIAITTEEEQILKKEGIKNLVVVPNIHEAYYEEKSFKTFSERSGLIFIGGYAHKPNIDAAKWLIEDIMPNVWLINPDIEVILLGSNPSPEVLTLQSDRVFVPGFVNDVTEYFNDAKLFIAPLRFGAGMKGKIGQSLSYALPIITSDIGAEGIGLKTNENFILANSADEFIAAILKLYNDQELWHQISEGSKEVLKKYHPNQVKNIVESLLLNLS